MKDGKIVELDSVKNLEKNNDSEYNRLALNIKNEEEEEEIEIADNVSASGVNVEHPGNNG
jgi:hypothetical protein